MIVVLFMVACVLLCGCVVEKPYLAYDRKTIEKVRNKDEVRRAIESYPMLSYYHDEGVVCVISVRKAKACVIDKDLYIIRYNYIKREITGYGEKMFVLRTSFPEVYQMFCEGKVIVNYIYKYVDKDGHVKYHISYTYR